MKSESLTAGSGDRDAGYAIEFMNDLKDRLANRVQLTSDGHKAYVVAVDATFGDAIDYAQRVKLFGEPKDAGPEQRHSSAVCTGAKKHWITGLPAKEHVSTSFVERQNLTMRMHMRRFTRLTNAFSKKVENHAYAVALHAMYYNFVRIHSKLRMTPAMAAGVTTKLWKMGDIAKLVEDGEKQVGKRGPYRKRKPDRKRG